MKFFKLLPHLMVIIALLGSPPVNGRRRWRVVKKGTTIPPNVKAVRGQFAIQCPVTHPYVYKNREKCCKSIWKSNSASCPQIYGPFLQYTDPEDCCPDGEGIKCEKPEDRKCRTKKRDFSKTCPPDYPFAFHFGTKCCKFHKRSEFCSSGSFSTDLSLKDADDCCIENGYIDCLNSHQVVVQCNFHRNHRSFCGIDSTFTRIGERGFKNVATTGDQNQAKGICSAYPGGSLPYVRTETEQEYLTTQGVTFFIGALKGHLDILCEDSGCNGQMTYFDHRTYDHKTWSASIVFNETGVDDFCVSYDGNRFTDYNCGNPRGVVCEIPTCLPDRECLTVDDGPAIHPDGPVAYKMCQFPFEHNGKHYSTCIHTGVGHYAMCKVKDPEPGKEWGYCDHGCPMFDCWTSGVTNPSGGFGPRTNQQCKFPSIYKNFVFQSCHDYKWEGNHPRYCHIVSGYNLWGYCPDECPQVWKNPLLP